MMKTPIADFVKSYSENNISRLHMPGHKGKSMIGCEAMDITEVKGADALYEADGIIAESERNAAELFNTAATFYSTEGSSQCIRAMLYLAVCTKPANASNTIIAFRNVHRSFIYACALLDIKPIWLYPKAGSESLCACPITAEELESSLKAQLCPPAAVYITSPDYLGNMADIKAFSELCHSYGTKLIVDNAHGAYLNFLPQSLHPMALGADICCDSAHKTLPVLTGGAYLHISKSADKELALRAKTALALFGSTSPSYLTLASLDKCNAYLADNYRERLESTIDRLNKLKEKLLLNGWGILPSDPLKLTIQASKCGVSASKLADKLREHLIEAEFADPDEIVFMFTPENSAEDFNKLYSALGKAPGVSVKPHLLPTLECESVLSPREALFSRQETIIVDEALGRICGSPTVACPPAIPIVVAGEKVSESAIEILHYYGTETIDVIKC